MPEQWEGPAYEYGVTWGPRAPRDSGRHPQDEKPKALSPEGCQSGAPESAHRPKEPTMTKPITPIPIEELKRLIAEATKGPWKHVSYCGMDLIGTGDRPREPANHICQLSDKNEAANAALITAAVNSLPSLIAEVERLREAGSALIARLDETMPPRGAKPKIFELEGLLAAGSAVIEIKPDGSIHVVPREEIEALRAALSGDGG
jgi:hypothetical protein